MGWIALAVVALAATPSGKTERSYVTAAKSMHLREGPNSVTAKGASLGEPTDRVHALDDGSSARLISWHERTAASGNDYAAVWLHTSFLRCTQAQGLSWCLVSALVQRCRGSGHLKCTTLYELRFR